MISIHPRSESFSEKWTAYCDRNNIPYKLVDCYSTNIIEELQDCDGLMWHWGHYDHKAVLFARQLGYSLEAAGISMFPNASTAWHFDDKVGQKYLLEAIGAPLVPSHVFYEKDEALLWAKSTTYPKVFKLRGGAGSQNVRIVRTSRQASSLIRKAFGKGFSPTNRWSLFTNRLWHVKRDKNIKSFLNLWKGFARLFIPTSVESKFPRDRNYAYFQDFIPNNDHDIRVIVIGKRAFAIKRMVRDGDFRASGSGHIIYDPDEIPQVCLAIAFDMSERLGAQSLAYDFIFDGDQPLIVEVSYAFSSAGYLSCPGYWTDQLEWVEGKFFPEYFMIEDFVAKIKKGEQ